jgi:hypothetical protein
MKLWTAQCAYVNARHVVANIIESHVSGIEVTKFDSENTASIEPHLAVHLQISCKVSYSVVVFKDNRARYSRG